MVCPLSASEQMPLQHWVTVTLALSLHLRVHSLSADAQGQDWRLLCTPWVTAVPWSSPAEDSTAAEPPQEHSHGQQQNIFIM